MPELPTVFIVDESDGWNCRDFRRCLEDAKKQWSHHQLAGDLEWHNSSGRDVNPYVSAHPLNLADGCVRARRCSPGISNVFSETPSNDRFFGAPSLPTRSVPRFPRVSGGLRVWLTIQ